MARMHERLYGGASTPFRFYSGRAHAIGPHCLIDQNECIAQCGGGTVAAGPPVAFHQASNNISIPLKGAYGAIAYDKGAARNLADASPNQDGANRSALGFCGKYGPHCFDRRFFLERVRRRRDRR